MSLFEIAGQPGSNIGMMNLNDIFGKALGKKNSAGTFNWGGASSELVVGAGTTTATNALKWTLGGNWTGYGWNLNPKANMSFEWPTDSLQLTYKSTGYSGSLRLQFEAGSVKLVKILQLQRQIHIPLLKLL